MNTTRHGLTLIELLVGITISGLTMTAGYGALAAMMDNRDRLSDQSEAVVSPATRRRALADWLAGARIIANRSYGQFKGLDGIYENWPDDALTLATIADTPLDAGGLSLMRLYVEREDSTGNSGLMVEFRSVDGQRQIQVNIEPAVRGLDLRYRSEVLADDDWWPSWISGTVLPAGLQITLSAAPEDPLPPLLALPLTVALVGGR